MATARKTPVSRTSPKPVIEEQPQNEAGTALGAVESTPDESDGLQDVSEPQSGLPEPSGDISHDDGLAVVTDIRPEHADGTMSMGQPSTFVKDYENKVSRGQVVAPEGIILKGNEPFRCEGDIQGAWLVLTKPVYREHFYPGTQRPTYILVHEAGVQLPAAEYINLTAKG